ncbi:polysaccharide biosynthesis tyrosine autokinase [Amnibacterium setariae]|nr:polysaccharide biosynthesis tyrosine autokinase [Amnibacterium setariae]
MGLREYLGILRKSLLLMGACVLLGAGLATAWTLTRTPTYDSESQVFVSTQGGGSLADLAQGSTFTQSRVATYTALVTTPTVTSAVIKSLNLNETSTSLPSSISASNPTNTNLIQITVTQKNPALAASIANALADRLTQTVQELETPVGDSSSPVKLTRVSTAQPSPRPSSPNVALNITFGILLGLITGLIIAFVRELVNTKVRTASDLEQVLSVPNLGLIPFRKDVQLQPLVVINSPTSTSAEAFRMLRTNLRFIEMGKNRCYVATSSLPTEGKSTTVVNLAIALAESGSKVVVVDADLRRPRVAEYLGIDGSVGLTDILVGGAHWKSTMVEWGNAGLHVLPSGPIPPNPSELLGSEEMTTLLAVLSSQFEIVLCDAPPLLPVTDSAILARATDGAILVVAGGRTSRGQVANAAASLTAAGANIAGTVLTMVRGSQSYGYAYEYADKQTGAA